MMNLNAKISLKSLSLEKMHYKKFLYPGIFAIIILIAGILFFVSANFLASAINAAFIPPDDAEAGILKLDLEAYSRVAGKLGIQFENSNPGE